MANNKLRSVKPVVTEWPMDHLSRRLQVTLTRLRIGHCRWSHAHLLMRHDAPTCAPCGDEFVSVRHVLCDCVVYRRERQRFGLSGDLSVVLCNRQEHLGRLFAFLGATNLIRYV